MYFLLWKISPFFLCINLLFFFSLSFFFPLAFNFSFLYYYFSHLISISLYFCAPINNGDKTAKTGSLKHRVASGRVKATRHYHPRSGRQSAQTAAAAKLVVFLRCGSSSLARSLDLDRSLSPVAAPISKNL